MSIAPNANGFATATCPTGSWCSAAEAMSPQGPVAVPPSDGAWRVAYENTSASNVAIWAYAVCANVDT